MQCNISEKSMQEIVMCMDFLISLSYIMCTDAALNDTSQNTQWKVCMKTIDLANLRYSDYSLRHVIAHMHYWREGSNWIIQEGGRSNTAIQALLSIGADYMDVNTHEIIASACPGDIVVIPQGIRYEFRAYSAQESMANISHLPNGNFYWDGVKHDMVGETQVANAIFMGFEMADENFEPLTVSDRIELIRLKDAAQVCKRMEQIARISGTGFSLPASITAKTYELLTMLSEIVFNKKPRSSAYRKIEPALQCIANRQIGTITVSELSELCSLSQSGFRKLFRQEMDISPIRYIQERTLNRIVTLLSTSDISITEVAIESGFQDLFYFSRFFRKMTGMSPSQWRNARTEN